MELSGCPQQQLDRATKELVDGAEWMETGILPVSGGWLDQAAAFIEQAKFYSVEKNRVEAERYKR